MQGYSQKSNTGLKILTTIVYKKSNITLGESSFYSSSKNPQFANSNRKMSRI